MKTPSPYKGLDTYTAEDSDRFFGRDDDRQILIDKVFSARVTLFFGVTGAGKSSLLLAGVIPELAAHEGYNLNVAYHSRWNPHEDPRLSLKSSINEALLEAGILSSAEAPGRRDATLKDFVEQYELFASDPFVIVIDQFEEFFLYHAGTPVFDDFIQELSELINDRELSLAFIVSMREDFLAELDLFWDKVPDFSHNRYRLEKLSREKAKEAILKPVDPLGFSYEAGLVERLLDDLSGRQQLRLSTHQSPKAGQPTTDPQHAESRIETPYLQIVCQALWQAEQDNPQKTLRFSTYQKELGGTKHIVRNHVEHAMKSLRLQEQVLAFEMFRYLVTARGTKMAYRDEDLADEQMLGVPVEDIRPVLEHLAGREIRILRSDNRPDGTWYELYHDVFAEIIREWAEDFQQDDDHRAYSQIAAAARKWRTEGYEDSALLHGGRLTQAEEWSKHNPNVLNSDERRFLELSLKKHYRGVWLRRGIVVLIALFAVISAIAGLYANVKSKEAVQQSRLAIIRSLVAYALQDNAQDERERAALLARHAYLLNQQHDGHVEKQIETALRTIFHTSAIVEGPGHNATGAVLSDLVCQQVRLKLALTPDEWTQFTDNAFPYEPACPELSQTYPLRLRSARIIASAPQALSLNLDNSDYPRPAQYIENQFEDQGDVIFDEATNLMWQKGSESGLTQAEAVAYCAGLSLHEKENWRLPTIEELVSLLEQEEPVLFFRLTADAFEELKSGEDPVPDNVVALLQPLTDQQIIAETDFLSAVQRRIGAEDMARYQARILELARNRSGFYINPMFENNDWVVWSADIYKIKGEGSEGSAWFVYFHYGYVYWGLAYSRDDVRCVRFGQ